MAQNDLVIANQSFPSFRSDLNSALQAINTTQSGTSRPSGAVAGTIWLDTTSATSPTLKYYDGADDISLATIDHTANTVNWLDSTVSITGLSTTATGTVLTLTDSAHTTTVNMICGNNTALRFNELTANGSNYVGLKAPASLSADLTFTLPSTDGTSGQFLKTDGSGNLSFASLSFATPLAVVGDATAGASIRLPEDTDNGSNYVALKAPDNLASNLTLTLPSADGTSGQVLQTNGSGVLSFGGAGKVLQVVSTNKSDTWSSSGTGNFQAVTGLSLSITPASTSNKIFIVSSVQLYQGDYGGGISIFRGGSQIVTPASVGSRSVANSSSYAGYAQSSSNLALSYLDSPSSTSALTYQIYAFVRSGTYYINRSSTDTDSNDFARTISTITAFEIAP
jgi:hypothetical protein